MENLILIIKGFILGIANVIPGVSGGTLAITLGIYEKLIEIIGNFRKSVKENIKFIIYLAIGIIIALLIFSNIIGYFLDKFPFITILFFIGFIVGGLPLLFNKVKGNISISNMIIFLITFLVVMLMTFMKTNNTVVSLDNLNFIKCLGLFFSGFIASASMLLPGISGSFVLMLLGYYEPIIDTIRDLTRFNNVISDIIVLGIAGIGILFGIFVAAKLIGWLLKKYEVKTYYGIIGFVIASIVSIFINVLNSPIKALDIVLGIVMFMIGIFLSKIIGEK